MRTPKHPKWRVIVILLGAVFYTVVGLCILMVFDTWATTQVYSPERIPSELQESSRGFQVAFFVIVAPLLFITIVLVIRNLYRMATLHDDRTP